MSTRRFHPFADGSLCSSPIVDFLGHWIRDREENASAPPDPILAFSPTENVCRATIRCVSEARVVDDPAPDYYERDVYNYSVDHLRHLFNLDSNVNPAVVVLATRVRDVHQSHTGDPDVDNSTMFVSVAKASTTLFSVPTQAPQCELLMDPTQSSRPSATPTSTSNLSPLRGMEMSVKNPQPIEVRTHRHFWTPKAFAYIDAAITGAEGFRSKQEATSMYLERPVGVTDLAAVRMRDVRREAVDVLPVIAGSGEWVAKGRSADYPQYAIRRYHEAANGLAPETVRLAISGQRMMSNTWHKTLHHAIRCDKLMDAQSVVMDLRPVGTNASSREHALTIRTWRRVVECGPGKFMLPEFKCTIEIVGVSLG